MIEKAAMWDPFEYALCQGQTRKHAAVGVATAERYAGHHKCATVPAAPTYHCQTGATVPEVSAGSYVLRGQLATPTSSGNSSAYWMPIKP